VEALPVGAVAEAFVAGMALAGAGADAAALGAVDRAADGIGVVAMANDGMTGGAGVPKEGRLPWTPENMKVHARLAA